ncbi:general stress protein CsbD [Labilibaculum antarcticum]|uniref:General stress protein CsbD n=1 Tax=Labilibaculum antarcticum TaxID=1717717 RepID=A0A1Y1CLR2_9BACT|nr:general stress protein CsbD [Labilibaculum antarcticum]BAX81234.1 general stress protein CsbD [Labilibaculum antarcticum]
MTDTSKSYRNWENKKDKLKQKFAVLVNNDSLFEKGKKEALEERLQIKLGKTKKEVQNIIESL